MKTSLSLTTLRRTVSLAGKTLAVLFAALLLNVGADILRPQAAAAYPFWAQQNYESPREATGKIVCANCHLGKKPTEIEVPQSVLPDTVFKAVVKVPYDAKAQQVLGDGSKGGLNVGAVLMLPEGFTLAPADRISEDLKEEVGDLYIQAYAEDKQNILIVGPVSGDDHKELVFPVLSPNPANDKSLHYGTYQIHVGGNRGRGQVYPTGEKTNNGVFTATAAGVIADVSTDASGSKVTIRKEDGSSVTESIPAGPELIVAAGDSVTAGQHLTNDPNVGGFGQHDVTIVLQNPNRVYGFIAFVFAVMIAQIMLVLKKKQFEKVQLAEMDF